MRYWYWWNAILIRSVRRLIKTSTWKDAIVRNPFVWKNIANVFRLDLVVVKIVNVINVRMVEGVRRGRGIGWRDKRWGGDNMRWVFEVFKNGWIVNIGWLKSVNVGLSVNDLLWNFWVLCFIYCIDFVMMNLILILVLVNKGKY